MNDRLQRFDRVEFVDFMPSDKEWGVLYVSLLFGLVICQCPDGCGEEAIMPIKPHDPNGWEYTEHDGLVTLSPSVLVQGCNAHFYIRENKVIWV